jgi:SPX domain protein involved in polyphosphate accumulation
MRRELKLVQDINTMHQILDYLRANSSFRVHHPSQFVNSLYFDDASLSNAFDNLSGISERKKVRLRWYDPINNVDKLPSEMNLEIKRKKASLSNKEVFKINNINPEEKLTYVSLTKYLNTSLNNYKISSPLLQPTLQVQYYREYYIIDSEIRITVDYQLKFIDAISQNKPNKFSFEKFDKCILEIKFHPKLTQNVASIINKLKCSPVRNSKYLIGLSLLGYIKYL